jgi:hypothetical protein
LHILAVRIKIFNPQITLLGADDLKKFDNNLRESAGKRNNAKVKLK